MKKRIQVVLITIFFMMNFVAEFSSLSAVSSGTTSPSLFTPSMSTHSINEQAIEAVYGASGLKLSASDVTQIKQTYSYIESIVKAIKIKNDPTLSSSFSKYYASQKASASMVQDIMNSKEWKSVQVTNKDIQTSEFCQLYIKSMIVDYYDNQTDFIESISMTQNQMYPYLANIELNFYNNAFIKLRTFAELLRVEKILQDAVLQRYLAQSTDWKGKDQATLAANFTAFKATDFYKYTHDKNAWSNPAKTMPHPLHEYVMGYFMLVTIQSAVQGKMTQSNLFSFLAKASSPTISPNFFPYQSVDVASFDDIFTLQQVSTNIPKVSSGNKNGSQKTFDIKDLVDISKVTNSGNNQNVIIQKGISMKSVTHSISHAADEGSKDLSKGASDVEQVVTHPEDDAAALQKVADDQAAALQKEANDQAAALKKEADDAAAAEAQKAQQKIVEQEAYKQAADDAAAAKKAGQDQAMAAKKDAQDAAKTMQPVTQVMEDTGNITADLGEATVDVVAAGGQSAVGNALVETGNVTGDQNLTQAGQQQKEQSKKDMAQATSKVESDAQQAADQLEKDTVTKATDAAVKGLDQAKVASKQLAQQAANQSGETAVQNSAQQDMQEGISKTEAAPITHQVESIKSQDFVTIGDQTAQFGDQVAANKDFKTAVNASEEGLADASQEVTKENAVADKSIAKENTVVGEGAINAGIASEKGIQTAATITGQGMQTAATVTGQGIQTSATTADKSLAKAAVTTGQGMQTAASVTGQGIQTFATTADKSLAKAAVTTGQGIQTSATTVDKSLAKAAVTTGQGIQTAGVATGQGIQTAGVATGQGLETAGVATGQGLETAGVATGTTLEYTAAAAGQGAAGAVLIETGNVTGDQAVKNEGEKQKAQAAQDAKKAGLDVAAQGITTAATATGQGLKTAATATGDTLEHATAAAGESLAGAVLVGAGSEIAAVTGDQTVKNEGEKQKAQAAQDANATGYKQFDANVVNAAQTTAKGTVDTAQDIKSGTVDTASTVATGSVKTAQTTAKGTVDTGKTAVQGTVDTGKTAVQGTVDTGKTAVQGTVDTGKTAVKGTVDTGKTAVKGTVDTGKTAVQGTVDTGKTAVQGTVSVAETIGSGSAQTIQDTGKLGNDAGKGIVTGATTTGQFSQNLGTATGLGIAGTGALAVGNITGDQSTKDWGNQQNKQALDATQKSGIDTIGYASADIVTSTEQGLKQTAKATENDIVGSTNAADFVNVGTSTASMVTHGATAAAQGIAGGAALAVGSELGIKSATTWGNKETAQALQNAEQTDKAFNNTIANLAKFGLLGPIVYGIKGIEIGSAGLGATLLGDIVYAETGNSSIKNWGSQQSNDAINNIKKAGDGINNIIASTALVLEDGIVAPVALALGAGVGIITQNKQMGQDLTLIINQILDSVVNVAAVALTSLTNLADNYVVQVYKVADSAEELIVDGVMIAYGELANEKDGRNRSINMSSDTSKQLAKNMLTAVTSTLSCVVSSGMDVMMSVVQVLSAVENSMTTIMFDLVDEITFLGASFGELMGAPINAQQERDKIDAKMEEHRATINIVMSVVLTVAVTVATLGTATPALMAAEAAETAATAATAVTAEATGDAVLATATTTVKEGATVGIEQGAKVGAEQSAKTATEQTAEQGAKEGAEVGEKQTAEQGGKQAAKDGAAQAAKSGTEQAAKKTMTQQFSEFAALNGAIIGQGINIVFSVFGIIGQENKDEAAITTLAQEKASIINLWQFIESNKVVMTQGQNIYLDELTKKHQSAIGNQTFGLNYYTNYLNSTINNMQSQISHALSQQYIQMLTPDETGSKIADIGSSWGLTTPFVYLYPSQGFLTTTLGRKNFPYAQEIAQAPLVAQSVTSSSTSKSLDGSSAQSSALWFNQRAVSIVDQAVDAPLNVEIKFRVIYNLSTEFHVGLYLGGKYYDYNSPQYLADIKNNGGIHLDDAHLAKMFVVKRDNGDKTPSIGVYENEGKGWIINKPLDSSLFNHATICHMSATLNKNKLTVSLWTEDKPNSVSTNTVDVTPCDQKTFGLIFSGAAIEWDVVKPSKVIQQNAQVRTATTTPLEADRERVARKAWAQLRNPSLGIIKLASLGKKYLFQGQYVYSTKDTPLKDKNGAQLTDIVAFATFVAGSCSSIGSTPTPVDTSTTPNAIISMINGDIYNAKGIVVGNQKDPWTLFTQSNGPFDQGLIDTVTKTQQACPPKPVAVSTQTISFDSFDVGDAPSVGGFEFGLSAPTDSGGSDDSFGSLQLGAADGFSFDFGDFGDSF